jgi:hypothetical protein
MVGAVAADIPMWSSRQAWLDQVQQWVYSDAGRLLCAQRHIRPELVIRVAIALAAFADGATGRNCAATNRAIAAAVGCSESLVSRVRNHLLGPAGFAIEVRRGTGGVRQPNKASVWHLIPVAGAAEARVSDLPTSRRESGSSHLEISSPRARKRAGESTTSKRGRGRRSAPPRPLAVQKMAAELVAASVGLEKVHPGQICDALTRSGLDLDRWDARQIAAALEADMRDRGMSWPDRIARPGAFLAARLRRLPAQPPISEQTPTPPRKESLSTTPAVCASPAVRRSALAQMRAQVAAATALWRPRLQTL